MSASQRKKRVRCQYCKRTGHKGRSHERDQHPGYPRSKRERIILAESIESQTSNLTPCASDNSPE